MPAATLDTLRSEFTSKHTENETIIGQATTASRDLTAEEKTKTDANFARLGEIKNLLEANAKLAQSAFTAGKVTTPLDPPGKQDAEIFVGMSPLEKRAEWFKDPKNRQKYKQVFNVFASTGAMIDPQFAGSQFDSQLLQSLRATVTPEQFATITTATQSGILLPKAVLEPLVPSAPNTIRQAIELTGAKWANLDTDTTQEISLPVMNGSAGSKVSETANSETEQPPGFSGSIDLKMSMYQSGSAWFSNLLLNANAFDLVGATIPQMYYSKELALESDILTTMAADSNITQKVTLATGTGLTGFTYANMVSFNRILPKRYGFVKVMILNKAAYTAAENLTTTTGFPILNQDAQNSELKKFNGTYVLWTDYLSGFGANNVIGLTFSMLGFRLRDCDATNLVQRYTQSPARPAQTGFNLFAAHAFGYDPNAVGELVCPAS